VSGVGQAVRSWTLWRSRLVVDKSGRQGVRMRCCCVCREQMTGMNEDGQSSDGCWMMMDLKARRIQSRARLELLSARRLNLPLLHSIQALSTEAVAARWHIKVSVLLGEIPPSSTFYNTVVFLAHASFAYLLCLSRLYTRSTRFIYWISASPQPSFTTTLYNPPPP
jgi:hypothetical protein